jgi:hypothetical protein
MKFVVYSVTTFLLIISQSSAAHGATTNCPDMTNSYTCVFIENSTEHKWAMKTTQREENGVEIYEILHFFDGLGENPNKYLMLASDEGYLNENNNEPEKSFITKCDGDRVNYYYVGQSKPVGTDRKDKDGNWVSAVYNEDGSESVVVTCYVDSVSSADTR